MHVGKWPAAILAIKKLAGVALEVNLRECTLHLPLQKKLNKAEPTLALKPRGDPKQGTSGPKMGHICLPKALQFLICQIWQTNFLNRIT